MKLTLLVLLCGLKSMSKFLRLCKNFQSYKDCLGSGLTCQVCDGPNGQCNTPSENYNVTSVVCPEENDACLYKAISMCIPRVPTSFGWDFINSTVESDLLNSLAWDIFYILSSTVGYKISTMGYKLYTLSTVGYKLYTLSTMGYKLLYPIVDKKYPTLSY